MCVFLDRGFVTFMSFPNGEKKRLTTQRGQLKLGEWMRLSRESGDRGKSQVEH